MSSWFRESRVVYTGIFAYCVFCPFAAHFYSIPLFFFFSRIPQSHTGPVTRNNHKSTSESFQQQVIHLSRKLSDQ
jgi:hypothetical protein